MFMYKTSFGLSPVRTGKKHWRRRQTGHLWTECRLPPPPPPVSLHSHSPWRRLVQSHDRGNWGSKLHWRTCPRLHWEQAPDWKIPIRKFLILKATISLTLVFLREIRLYIQGQVNASRSLFSVLPNKFMYVVLKPRSLKSRCEPCLLLHPSSPASPFPAPREWITALGTMAMLVYSRLLTHVLNLQHSDSCCLHDKHLESVWCHLQKGNVEMQQKLCLEGSRRCSGEAKYAQHALMF